MHLSVCLDSWAVLAWLDGDEAAAAIGRLRAVLALDDVTAARVLAAARIKATPSC